VLAARYEPGTVAARRGEPKGPHKRTAYWVRAIFEASGRTQESFAEHAKVSRGGLTKWMDGLQKPSWDIRQKLIRVAPAHLKDFDAWDRNQTRPPNGEGSKAGSLRADDSGITPVTQPTDRHGGLSVTSPFERNLIAMIRSLQNEHDRERLRQIVEDFVLTHTTGSRPPVGAAQS
jgi:transcriptional regulator with XRE-family HTH domain